MAAGKFTSIAEYKPHLYVTHTHNHTTRQKPYLYSTYYEPDISKAPRQAFIRSGISLPSFPRHRRSLHFGWFSFPVPLRVGG